MGVEISEIISKWSEVWPSVSPLSADIRSHFANIAFRIHTLPNGKRYPTSLEERKTILYRHHVLLTALISDTKTAVITSDWTSTESPLHPHHSARANIDPMAIHWMTYDMDQEELDPEFKSYQQIYVNCHTIDSPLIDDILNNVMDDALSGVIIASMDLKALYMPYDGGADIVVADRALLKKLKNLHPDWIADIKPY